MTNILDYITLSTLVFFTMQFINVILSTMKTILTVKANVHVAMLINTATYTFYSGVVKLLTDQPMIVVLVTTFVTNMLSEGQKRCHPHALCKIDLTKAYKLNKVC